MQYPVSPKVGPSRFRRFRLFSPILAGATLRERLIDVSAPCWPLVSPASSAAICSARGRIFPDRRADGGVRGASFRGAGKSAGAAMVNHRRQYDFRPDGDYCRLLHSRSDHRDRRRRFACHRRDVLHALPASTGRSRCTDRRARQSLSLPAGDSSFLSCPSL